ncbi:MAG: phospholipase [Chloroflexi bacterium]|mgnify:CR=1 FL=1|nr:phospholipase [Chloroflexota bacterium]
MTGQENLIYAGTPLDQARAAAVLVHGRGATADSMLPLVDHLQVEGLAFIAPQAPGSTWYPYTFLAPVEQNEPYLSNALNTLSGLFDQLEQAGIPPERVFLIGFSQGACLSLEFAARNPRRYGGIGGLSGGLIGPPGQLRSYTGSLNGTPVFLGCSDPDPHIPRVRVLETAQILENMQAEVVTRIYDNLGHTINEDELHHLQQMIGSLQV